jgi:hypothetical protein
LIGALASGTLLTPVELKEVQKGRERNRKANDKTSGHSWFGSFRPYGPDGEERACPTGTVLKKRHDDAIGCVPPGGKTAKWADALAAAKAQVAALRR